jgi:TetR/AcrR family transcriptional regulator, transcriptional repressor for nem operon
VKEHAVRYSREHKQAMRQRIIEAAGRRFKTDGIDGSGIAALMADAGLTNGAFYAHSTPRTIWSPQRSPANCTHNAKA